MKRRIHPVAAGLLAAAILAACQPATVVGTPSPSPATAGTGPTSSDDMPRITPAALMPRITAGEAILIVDVRSPEAFAVSHIASAINIPFGTLAANHALLPKDRFIALYCT